MNVSKTSWHFRAVTCFNIDPSSSLCLYFWQVIATTIIFPTIIVAFCIIIAAALLTSLVGLWATPAAIFGWIVIEPDSFFAVSRIFGFFAYMFIAYLTSEHIVHSFSRCIRIYKNKEVPPPKNDSLLVAYVKAKKRKICPIITYID